MHNWNTFGARMNHGQLGFTRLIIAWTWGKSLPSPYSIFDAFSQGPHPNGFLSQDFQVEVPKLPKLGFLQLWGLITLCGDLRLGWSLKQSYSLCRKLSNGISHATCTKGNQGDSQLLMVRSQIANLTPSLSFGHNLCFKCPNGSCKPVLDIYVSIAFQWYEELFEPLCFDPCNHFWTFGSPPGLQLPTWEFTLECEGSFPHTLLHSQGHENATLRLNLGSHPCKPFVLVANRRLGLRH
jgi:hypothetical protein